MSHNRYRAMAGGEFSDNTVDAASESEKDVLINQATVFDNINYMGRAVIGKLLHVCYNACRIELITCSSFSLIHCKFYLAFLHFVLLVGQD